MSRHSGSGGGFELEDRQALSLLYERGRRNSIGFVRFALATCVVFSHSFRLGGFGPEPLTGSTGQTLGTLAVDSFFILSGFLIARSFVTCASVWRYLWHRTLRIFPAYWFCLGLTALVIGPLIKWSEAHALAWNAYLHSWPSPSGYVLRNLFLRTNQIGIDGLLQRAPFPNHLNGALWSLEHEFKCYLALALIGVLGVLQGRFRRALLPLLFAALVIVLNTKATGSHFTGTTLLSLTLAVWFLAGATFYVFADEIPVRWSWFAVAMGVTVLAYSSRSQGVWGPIPLAYVLFFLSLKMPLSWWDRRADLSYGIYIYAFPIQQLLASTSTLRAGVWVYFIATMSIATPLALVSWMLVERPALRLKDIWATKVSPSKRSTEPS